MKIFTVMAAVWLGLQLTASEADAARFCQVGKKKYTMFSTRCDAGKKLRCVGVNKWKVIGKCKPRPVKKGAQFCQHAKKKYSVGATRCEGTRRFRCAAKNLWKPLGKCPLRKVRKKVNRCKLNGRSYSVGSTRCDAGNHPRLGSRYRCMGDDLWKPLGTCKLRKGKASVFCRHGGKHYSVSATRCVKGKHLRCVARDTWKRIGKCK
jgi:hypothetical protein